MTEAQIENLTLREYEFRINQAPALLLLGQSDRSKVSIL